MSIVSPMYDIFSLIDRYASIQVAYKSVVRGVLEIHSNCPFCGGHDRFVTRPETGQYSCAIRASGCGRHGDCLDFLKDFMNMSHQEACEVLQIETNADYVPSSPSQNAHVGNESPPNKEWQSQGKNLIERAQKYLWSSGGKDALAYLHGRGLGDEIIKKKKLGYIPLQKNGKYYESELEQWGLDPEHCKKDAVRIPPGILIPWFYGNELWRLALKRIDKNEYGQVLGSGEGLFNVNTIQYDTPAMMVESEFCSMAVEQEAGDLIACVATGSTTRGRLNKWVAELGLASYVLQSFDEDESGDTGSEYWMQNLKKCMRWSPYVAKDPNDILRKKFLPDRWECSLREWVEAGISIMGAVMLPFALPPVGGIENVPTVPLARGTVKRKDFPIDLSKTKWYGPEVDLKVQFIQEYVGSHLAPGICLNKDCPCQEVWGKWVLERALKKK